LRDEEIADDERTSLLRNTGARPSSRSGEPPASAHRIGARLLHEARGALVPTIFFFLGFNLDRTDEQSSRTRM
jgi:hypothetical protein